jgi:putative hydrolase of the HAD superfamily
MIDVGGVLLDSDPRAFGAWSARLGIAPASLLAALFGGCDDQVLVGAVSEPDWWDVVGARLGIGAGLRAELRRDVARAGRWDDDLLACLRRIRRRAGTAIVSNAWPHLRARLSEDGIVGVVDEVVLSCEVGWAKPDPRIYAEGLRRLAVEPGAALFIDDTAGHVTAARSLGIAAHQHVTTAGTIAAIDAGTSARIRRWTGLIRARRARDRGRWSGPSTPVTRRCSGFPGIARADVSGPGVRPQRPIASTFSARAVRSAFMSSKPPGSGG